MKVESEKEGKIIKYLEHLFNNSGDRYELKGNAEGFIKSAKRFFEQEGSYFPLHAIYSFKKYNDGVSDLEVIGREKYLCKPHFKQMDKGINIVSGEDKISLPFNKKLDFCFAYVGSYQDFRGILMTIGRDKEAPFLGRENLAVVGWYNFLG